MVILLQQPEATPDLKPVAVCGFKLAASVAKRTIGANAALG
jgi:hypothetical protein